MKVTDLHCKEAGGRADIKGLEVLAKATRDADRLTGDPF